MGKAQDLHFAGLVLEENGLFGSRNGDVVHFTRSERALLLALSRNPRRLMTRAELLDRITSSDSNPSDRNVDFLVSRLRIKLGDSARSPRYIATQYGEGYVWIAAPGPATSTEMDTFLAIVPALPRQATMFGLPVASVMRELRDSIAEALGGQRKVVVAEPDKPEPDVPPLYFLKLSFHDGDGRQSCTAHLQEMPSKRVVKVFSLRRDAVDGHSARSLFSILSAGVSDYFLQILAEMTHGLGVPPDLPLEERLWNASNRLTTGSHQMWLEKGADLDRDRATDPSVDTALQWGLHLFSRLVLSDPFRPIDPFERDRMESEMEQTALASLPDIEANPVQMLAAAKLLYFVNRGHLELAQDIAERAATQMFGSPAPLPLLAQIYSARGRTSEALKLLRRGIDMSGANLEFFIHTNVLTCIALLATGDARGAADVMDALEDLGDHCPPAVGLAIGLMAAPTDRRLPRILSDALTAAGGKGAGHALEFLYFTSARQHVSPVARAHVMRGMTAHVTRIHGLSAVPAFLRSTATLQLPARPTRRVSAA